MAQAVECLPSKHKALSSNPGNCTWETLGPGEWLGRKGRSGELREMEVCQDVLLECIWYFYIFLLRDILYQLYTL
jgi:hypothetical protein